MAWFANSFHVAHATGHPATEIDLKTRTLNSFLPCSREQQRSFTNEMKPCTDLFLRALLAGYFSS